MAANPIIRETDHSIAGDLVKGALAGAAGAVAMDRIGWAIMKRESISTLEQEAEAQPNGMDPAHMMVNRMAGRLGMQLDPEQPHPAGITMFFALAMLPGALYGVLLNRVNQLGFAKGLVYGLTLFVVMDEMMPPVLGLSNHPRRYPWQAHARGLVSHLALGLVTYGAFQLLNRLTGSRK